MYRTAETSYRSHYTLEESVERLRTEQRKSEEFGLEFETGKGRVPVICQVWKLDPPFAHGGIPYVLRLVLDENPEGGTVIQAKLEPSTGALVTIHLIGGAYVFLLLAAAIGGSSCA